MQTVKIDGLTTKLKNRRVSGGIRENGDFLFQFKMLRDKKVQKREIILSEEAALSMVHIITTLINRKYSK